MVTAAVLHAENTTMSNTNDDLHLETSTHSFPHGNASMSSSRFDDDDNDDDLLASSTHTFPHGNSTKSSKIDLASTTQLVSFVIDRQKDDAPVVYNLGQEPEAVDYRRKSIIEQAGDQVAPGWVFKHITKFFADRKFITIAFIHLTITLVVFTHFALEKFNSQKLKVPEGAPRYTWKIGVPTFEFGTMHAILFQLGALPLTMCRLIISKASMTFLGSVIPFNEALKCHIAIGYTLVFMLFMTIVVFLMFFGVLCSDGNATFCANFTSEIMITGYVIFGLFLSVAVTSYLRTVIPYRVFYVVHHIVFATYALTIAHTIDHVQRNKGGRSQTFKWFTASLLIYVTDRAAMYFNQRYHTKITPDSVIVESSDGKKMVILEVEKPGLLYFHPGQYLYLKIPSIDNIWHPFSVASSPTSENLVFYIEVFGEKSWTHGLYNKLLSASTKGTAESKRDSWEDNLAMTFDNSIQVMGPYGTGLADVKNYSHGVVIGAGTGIVPILSFFNAHVDKLLSFEPDRFKAEQEKHHGIISGLHEKKNKKGGSLTQLFASKCVGYAGEKPTAGQMKRSAYLHVYTYVLMFFGTIVGVALLGITISWNLLTFEPFDPMKKILSILTLVFQSSFVVLTTTVQDRASMWIYLDFIFIVLSGVANWNFWASSKWGRFGSVDIFISMIMTGYMVLRYWTTMLRLKYNPIKSAHKRRNGFELMDKVHLVWTTRSPTLISQMFPDLEKVWNILVEKFGEAFARQVCEISIYCTSDDDDMCDDLEFELEDTNLYKLGALKFERPNFPGTLEKHTTKRMVQLSLPASRTLVAFCGSPKLANFIKETKIMNDLAMFIAGVDEHSMDLVIESYGGTKPKEVKKNLKNSVRASLKEEEEGYDKEKMKRAGSQPGRGSSYQISSRTLFK